MLHHLVALSTSSALTFDERKDLLRKRDELIYARHPSVELVISALGLRFIVVLFELCRRVAVPHPDSSFSFSLLVFAAAVSANNLAITPHDLKLLARFSQTPLLRHAQRFNLGLQLLGPNRLVHPCHLRLPPTDEALSGLPRV